MAVKKMTTGTSMVSAPSILTVPESETYFERAMREVQQAIAERAYFLCQHRGFTHGNDQEDWFHAEAELFRVVPVELSEDENNLKVVAEVPGYAADDVDVHLEPNRLIIRGHAETEEHRVQGQLAYSELQGNQVFRAVHLPVEVDPEKANAVVRDGILEITLPKAQNAKGKRVRVQAA